MGSHFLTTPLPRGDRPAAPALVQWQATLRCPLSCPHCLSASSEGGPELPLSEALALVDQVAALGVGELLVTGGEPLARPDLGAIIERLAERRVRWSLNTAVMPTEAQQRALRSYPPALVAVSLDGPEPIHDQFRGRQGAYRGALAALRFFAELGGAVVAGTTVTTANARHLGETFRLVQGSGATAWGIHLLVPEGRARAHPELFLSSDGLREVLAFVARTRPYFPVTLADELGYCGDWEPLVRDVPLSCGAGWSQCVVLADGEVVPCTTPDRRASAGNIRSTGLAEIWQRGFSAALGSLPQACRECDVGSACQGGCWLQRREKAACRRPVWDVFGAMRTTAGVAVCLGAIHAQALAATPNTPPAPPAIERPQPVRSEPAEFATVLDRAIVALYAPDSREGGSACQPPSLAPVSSETLERDPGGRCVLAFRNGTLPGGLVARAQLARASLATETPSLGLIALSWRLMVEPGFDGPAPGARTRAERGAVRDALGLLRTKAEHWRREIFAHKLDPYLARGRTPARYSFQQCKALVPAPDWLKLVRSTAVERWSVADEALEGFLVRHRYADSMELTYSTRASLGVLRGKATRRAPLPANGTLGVFDLLVVPPEATGARMTLEKEGVVFDVALPPDAELTFVDLLRLVHEQHGEALREEARKAFKDGYGPGLNPLLAGAVRALALTSGRPEQETERRRAQNWLADFWLF